MKPSRLSDSDRALLTLTGNTLDAFIGIMLGDGCIQRRYMSLNSRFLFAQSGKPEKDEYFKLVLAMFSPYLTAASLLKGVVVRYFNGPVESGSIYSRVDFSTIALPCFTYYHTLFYVNGVKVVPEFIIELLTPCGLAH